MTLQSRVSLFNLRVNSIIKDSYRILILIFNCNCSGRTAVQGMSQGFKEIKLMMPHVSIVDCDDSAHLFVFFLFRLSISGLLKMQIRKRAE